VGLLAHGHLDLARQHPHLLVDRDLAIQGSDPGMCIPPGRSALIALCDDLAMIIVSGRIYVDEADRASYLQESRQVIVAARVWDGCIDFHLAADPIEPDRINVYEQWRSVEAVEAFRGAGPSSEQMAAIRDASVFQHEVASSTKL